MSNFTAQMTAALQLDGNGFVQALIDMQNEGATAYAEHQAAAAKFGTVETSDGTTLALTQQAYADNHGTDGGVRYYAGAIDEDGNAYRVSWDTTAAWDAREAAYRADPENAAPAEDESDACDWSAPAEIVAG